MRQPPTGRRRLGNALADQLLHVVNGAGIQKLYGRPVQGRHRHVEMSINQARHYSASVEINDLGIGTGLLEYSCIITHCNKSITADSHSLCGGEVLVDRDDLAVVKDEIGGLRPSRSSEQRAGKQKAGGQELTRTSADHDGSSWSREWENCAGSEGAGLGV